MDEFKINGGQKIQGSIEVLGAKNGVLPMMAASLLLEDGEITLKNVPDNRDIRVMLKLINELGAKTDFCKEKNVVTINPSTVNKAEAPYELVRKMRASFMVMGPLLARFGKARVSLPGGCAIGARPVDYHIRGFKSLGARVVEEHGYIEVNTPQLKGDFVYFDQPSHTGTENVMMAAALAEGETVILNAAKDPEIVDFANFLNEMGANIYGAGSCKIRIEGTDELHSVEYTPIGDRLEAGTYLMSAMVTEGEVNVHGVYPNHLEIVLSKLKEMGADIETGNSYIQLEMQGRPEPTNITTYPYPGFPTDLQAPAMALLSLAEGTSYISEQIFENRFLHVMELMRLGADIVLSGDEATVRGVPFLNGAEVMASDIRAGAGLVVAGLAARDETEILRIYHIDRGYQRLDESLNKLGANIERTQQ